MIVIVEDIHAQPYRRMISRRDQAIFLAFSVHSMYLLIISCILALIIHRETLTLVLSMLLLTVLVHVRVCGACFQIRGKRVHVRMQKAYLSRK